jgi:tetratricopeptide (TPR) repeat protein
MASTGIDENQDDENTAPLTIGTPMKSDSDTFENSENNIFRPRSGQCSEHMESSVFQTPLRGNVSAKHTSNHDTVRAIFREICFDASYSAHIIHGANGVGKTYCAYQCTQMPKASAIFSDGIIWLGLGYKNSLRFRDLIELYEQILGQMHLSKKLWPCFDNIFYLFDRCMIDEEEERIEERRAMIQARDLMSDCIGASDVLICIDGLADSADILLFQFQSNGTKKCRTLATAVNAPNQKFDKLKSWHLSCVISPDARHFFMKHLNSEALHNQAVVSMMKNFYDPCRGNLMSIKMICKLINDKIAGGETTRLKKFVKKFQSAPVDPKMQIFIILEATFSHSSLGETLSKLAWRCFAAFCTVFTRDNCSRPFVPKSPTRSLFRAVTERFWKDKTQGLDTHDILVTVDKIIDFLVQLELINFIDGFDCNKTPRQFYQVSSDVFQDFGEKLSANNDTSRKFHELLIHEYTSMFSGINAAFGSNEIDFYMLQFLPLHSMRANDFEDVSLTLQDLSFIEERFKFMGLLNGCKKHIDDTQRLTRKLTLMKDDTANILMAISYQNCTRALVKQFMNKDLVVSYGGSEKDVLEAMWMLAFSLFNNFLVMDGCKVVEKAMEFEKGNDPNRIFKMDRNLIKSLSMTPTGDDNKCSRAVIVIASSMVQYGMKKVDAMNLLIDGLKHLTGSLGLESLEVARAHVYVGEYFYRDFKMYRHARYLFKQALPTFLRELGKESEELYDAIILVGKSSIHVGELDTALDILEKINPKLSGTIAVDVRIKLGYIYTVKGNHDKAQFILNEARAMSSDQEIVNRIDEMYEKSVQLSGRCSI